MVVKPFLKHQISKDSTFVKSLLKDQTARISLSVKQFRRDPMSNSANHPCSQEISSHRMTTSASFWILCCPCSQKLRCSHQHVLSVHSNCLPNKIPWNW